MLDKMKALISEQLGVDESLIVPDADFKDDLGADSLDIFELLMGLEEEYGLEIPTEELNDIATVGDIIEYLKSKGIEA
ncbi:MAG: acyl carrier protein [Lachnospiraceae bacterium]